MGHKRLLESHDDVMLLQKIQLRAPYVTPLNVLQVPPFACHCLQTATCGLFCRAESHLLPLRVLCFAPGKTAVPPVSPKNLASCESTVYSLQTSTCKHS